MSRIAIVSCVCVLQGMQLQRKAAEERLSSSGAGQSFLARQRQAHNRRTHSINTPQQAR